MKVLHVTSLFFPDRVGGAELLVDAISASQAEMGHEVAVAALSRSAQPAEKRDGVTVFRLGHSTPFFILDWSRQSKWKTQYYKFAVQFDFGFVRRLERVLDEFRPDIVNTHSLSELPPFIWRMIARRGIPLVHTLHDFTSMCTNGALFHDGHICDSSGMRCRMFSVLHRRCHHGIRGVTAVGTDILSRHEQAGFFQEVPETLRRVIWNPILPPTGMAPRRKRREISFGYLGRIEPSKGIDVLLQACRKLPKEGWHLTVAGQAIGGLDFYRNAAAGLPVSFPGYTEIDDFFEDIDCLIVPPLWPEAFGRTVSESYLRGIPVLGSDLAGVAEQIGNDQRDWLFPPGDVEQLAGKMANILQSPQKLDQPIIGKDKVAELTRPETVAGQYIDLYDDVLRSSL
ncbi:glycosyltransferase family 4 protein [Rhizobium binxianense]